jgi:transcriptional regulator with XRE-family HTH domain
MSSGAVGERIAAYRRRRGLSQAALAQLVGRSESWLSQVERGVRSVDRLSVLLDLAKILHVDVASLTGSPWQYAPNGGSVTSGLDDLRRFFSRYDNLTGVEPAGGVTVASLATQAAETHAAYQAAKYEEVIVGLPELLTAADALHHTASSAERRDALVGYADAYGVAAKLLTKMGAGELALLAADRSATAAVDADELATRGLSAYHVVCALLREDRPEDAEHLAVTMADLTRQQASPDNPLMVSISGALWLIAAVISARRADRVEAWRRLAIAEDLAATLGEDANFGWTAFGPTNVAIHRVAVAAELGDPGEALRSSAGVDPASLPAGLNSRKAQIHIHLAWAQAQRHRDAEAVLHLMEAEQIAPQAVRYNVIVRELIRSMLARQKRMKTSALHALAVRAGVLD